MHMGRSHHVIVSIAGGFSASFLTFFIATYGTTASQRGQLLAGDATLNKNYPTTLNMMHGAMDGTNPILQSMSSYGWWTLVLAGGLLAAFILVKMLRRFA